MGSRGRILPEGPLPPPRVETGTKALTAPEQTLSLCFRDPGKGEGREERPRAAPSASLARKAAQQVWRRLPEVRGSSAARGPAFSPLSPGGAGSSPNNALRVPDQAQPSRPRDAGPSRSVKVLGTRPAARPRPAPPLPGHRPVNHRAGRARRERGARREGALAAPAVISCRRGRDADRAPS